MCSWQHTEGSHLSVSLPRHVAGQRLYYTVAARGCTLGGAGGRRRGLRSTGAHEAMQEVVSLGSFVVPSPADAVESLATI
jgi:hypothetical protein